ncbi:MAG: type II secretion system GspH family protein [Betaproteobacteria bacterium]|nr:type II secretion system GspH family protein [Betaproteobacteria bacterium]MDH3438222.1 type II secretion system GspH family protein [Betaproteobacteria bacterium]
MRRVTGFTYLTSLLVVAIMATGLALVGEVWHTGAMRDKEAELLFIGNQYRKAIERYYLSGPGQYPRNLPDLLKDSRKPGTERYLRQIYPDPITGKAEWGTVKAPDGGIIGVYSLSEDKPLKSANFRLRDKTFEGAATYADWKFVFLSDQQSTPKPAAGPAAPPVNTR